MAVGGRVIGPIEGVKVLVRVQGWLGGEAGRVIDVKLRERAPYSEPGVVSPLVRKLSL